MAARVANQAPVRQGSLPATAAGSLRVFHRPPPRTVTGLLRQLFQPAPQFDDELFADGLAVFLLFRRDQLFQQLVEADGWVDHDGLHVGQVLEVRIEVHGVEDAEGLLADVGAEPCRPADHLLVEDAAVHTPQEDQVGDRGHVDAGGQQVDGDGDLWVGIVAERADQLLDPVHTAGELFDRRVVDLAIRSAQRPS